MRKSVKILFIINVIVIVNLLYNARTEIYDSDRGFDGIISAIRYLDPNNPGFDITKEKIAKGLESNVDSHQSYVRYLFSEGGKASALTFFNTLFLFILLLSTRKTKSEN